MSRFIAVIHGWHVESNGFSVHQLESSTRLDAEQQACWLKHQRQSTFDRCAFEVIEIDDHEHLPRRLSLRERLTGKIQ